MIQLRASFIQLVDFRLNLAHVSEIHKLLVRDTDYSPHSEDSQTHQFGHPIIDYLCAPIPAEAAFSN